MVRVSLLLFGALVLPSHADDWTKWRGPDANGVSKEEWKAEALKGRTKIKWAVQVGEGHSGVCVTAKHVFTMGNMGRQDVVSCLDVETGKPVWRFPYKCAPGGFPGPRATPVLDGDLLFTLSRDGDAHCLDAKTGKKKWMKNLKKEFKARNVDYGFTGSPLIVGKAVIYNACESGVALNKETGEKIWASKSGNHGYATPVYLKYKEKDSVAIFSALNLWIVDAATGEQTESIAWKTDFDANTADPVLFDDKMYISSGWERGGALFELKGDSPRQVWYTKTLRSQIASPIYLDGHLYGIDDNTPNGRLCCIEAEKGKSKWSQKGGFENFTIAGGKILAIDKDGRLTVAEADPAGYKQLAQVQIFRKRGRYWTAPILANGRIYCRSSKGDLVSIDVK